MAFYYYIVSLESILFQFCYLFTFVTGTKLKLKFLLIFATYVLWTYERNNILGTLVLGSRTRFVAIIFFGILTSE